MSSNPNPVRWTVVSQQETMERDANGNFANGVRVVFQTDTGLTGSVFVPNPGYNPAAIAQAIAQKVRLMVSVHQLNGEVRPNP